MARSWFWMGTLVGAAALAGVLPGASAGDKKLDTGALLEVFSSDWPSDRTDHHVVGDDSWKAYARTLRAVVDAADNAALQKGLADENRQVRALCARALGYVGESASVEPLSRALASDTWPTVRLLAADSLGELDTRAARDALTTARTVEKSGDVLLHIDIALRREHAPGKDYAQALLSLTEADLEPATVGKTAPALSLKTPDGKAYALSDYRGKQPVVLVFIYGDG